MKEPPGDGVMRLQEGGGCSTDCRAERDRSMRGARDGRLCSTRSTSPKELRLTAGRLHSHTSDRLFVIRVESLETEESSRGEGTTVQLRYSGATSS
jgi:hypothetical protein